MLHLTSLNYLLKNKYTNLTCPDPVALVNLADLTKLNKKSIIAFFENVLLQFKEYNPADDISIRTGVSHMEAKWKRTYKLYLDPKEYRKNATYAYDIYQKFSKQNPEMMGSDAWIFFAMSTPEMFSGVVNSDLHWPTKVIMEVTSGPIAPLAYGQLNQPETYILNKISGEIKYKRGSNSPVLDKYFCEGLEMSQISQLMNLAGRKPCSLEYIFGPIKKINRVAPLIIDVRVMDNTSWKFYNTNTIWKVSDGKDFLDKLNYISSIVAVKDPFKNDSVLMITPNGSFVKINHRTFSIRALFDVDVFSPINKELPLKRLFPSSPRYLGEYFHSP